MMMTQKTQKIFGAILLTINGLAMAVSLTYAVLTIHRGEQPTFRKPVTAPVRYQTLNLLRYEEALKPEPDPVSPAPVIEPWDDDPYFRAYQAGKYDAADQYQEGDAEDYIPLDQASLITL